MNQKVTIEHKKINKKIVYNGLLFVLFFVAMLYLLLKDNNLDEVWRQLKEVNLFYVFLGVIGTFLYLCCEGRNFSKTLGLLNKKTSFINGLKYSCIGFFFSSITPSATGGGPFQVYYMTQDGVSLSKASLTVFLELAGFHAATLLITTIGVIVHFDYIMSLPKLFKILLFLGYLIKIILILMFMFGIFSRRLSKKIVDVFIKVLRLIKYKKADETKEKLYEELEKYGDGANFIKKHKKSFIEMIVLVTFQVAISYAVPYFIYLSFGLSTNTILTFITLQAILYSATSIVPIPGAMGASETGFLNIYHYLFPPVLLTPAMLLTRFVNFYLFVLLCGLVTIINQFIIGKRSSN